MRIIFMGSPREVISPCETTLNICRSSHHQLVGVISQPAKPAGRNKVLKDPPLAAWAKEQGLLTLQPEKSRSPEFIKQLAELQPDLLITAAYGQILSQEFLNIPSRGTINIHPSLLPKYRGASPVQTALYDGISATGVSILFTVKELDAGNIICQRSTDIEPEETAEELMPRLFSLGGEALKEALSLLENPSFEGQPQEPSQVSHCHKFHKNSGDVNWTLGRHQIFNRYRAFSPWPGSYTFLKGKRLVLEELSLIDEANLPPLAVGEFTYIKPLKSLVLGCIDGYLSIKRVKPEGSKSQDGASFWNGLKIKGKGRFDG